MLAGRPLHVPNVRIAGAPELESGVEAWRHECLRIGSAVLRGIALGRALPYLFFPLNSKPFFPEATQKLSHFNDARVSWKIS